MASPVASLGSSALIQSISGGLIGQKLSFAYPSSAKISPMSIGTLRLVWVSLKPDNLQPSLVQCIECGDHSQFHLLQLCDACKWRESNLPVLYTEINK